MYQNETLNEDRLAEQLVSMWYDDGVHQGVSEWDFYLETLISEFHLSQNDAEDFIRENIDLDEVY